MPTEAIRHGTMVLVRVLAPGHTVRAECKQTHVRIDTAVLKNLGVLLKVEFNVEISSVCSYVGEALIAS